MNKKQYVYPVYETNAWHSLDNRECKGIYTSKEAAIESIAVNHVIPLDEFEGLTKDEATESIKQELQTSFQTQGYTVNYVIEVWLLDDWA